MPDLSTDLVDRWFARVLTPPAEPGTRWPIALDLQLTPAEQSVVDEGRRWLHRALDPAGPQQLIRAPDPTRVDDGRDDVCRQVAAFLAVLSVAIGDTRQTLGVLAGTDLEGTDPEDPADRGGTGPELGLGGAVQADALAVAAGINAGAAALAGAESLSSGGPDPTTPRLPEESGPSAAQAARRAGEAAAEAAVGGADVAAVAGRAAAAMLSGWGPPGVRPPDGDAAATGFRVRAIVGRVLVGLQQVARPPDPPALPAPCGAGPGDVLGRRFTAEITCEVALPAPQVEALRAELGGLAGLVRLWPRSSGHPGGTVVVGAGEWQRVHVHTDRPGAVVEALFAGAAVFDLHITTLD